VVAVCDGVDAGVARWLPVPVADAAKNVSATDASGERVAAFEAVALGLAFTVEELVLELETDFVARLDGDLVGVASTKNSDGLPLAVDDNDDVTLLVAVASPVLLADTESVVDMLRVLDGVIVADLLGVGVAVAENEAVLDCDWLRVAVNDDVMLRVPITVLEFVWLGVTAIVLTAVLSGVFVFEGDIAPDREGVAVLEDVWLEDGVVDGVLDGVLETVGV
jgi:hypothetical protein